jgi:hypothetical protein
METASLESLRNQKTHHHAHSISTGCKRKLGVTFPSLACVLYFGFNESCVGRGGSWYRDALVRPMVRRGFEATTVAGQEGERVLWDE